MRPLLCALPFVAFALFLAGCTSTGSNGGNSGPEYYAPTPDSSIDRTVKLQDGIGGMTRSSVR